MAIDPAPRSSSKRILITGLSTYWGGRLAQELERDPTIETVIGVDKRPPKVELERTEFVRVADQHSLIRRIVQAAEIDTVVDTRLVVDSVVTTPRLAHENNVIGTMNVLAACGGPDTTVKRFIFKSSAHYYGANQDDPAFFTETMRRPHPPTTPIERDICEAEIAVREFADKHPDISVTTLRFANGLGPDLRTAASALLALPFVPAILGFDPRCQFIHEDDIAHCLEHAVLYDLDGPYNCAADGVLALSEVAGLLGKPFAPVIPFVGTGAASALLNRIGIPVTPEMRGLLRYGRGVDNRRMKATGFRYGYTTRETVLKEREHQRLHPLLRGAGESYRYEADVEEFLRWSPSVRAGRGHKPSPQQLVEMQKAISAMQEGDDAPVNVAPGGRRSTDPAPGLRAAEYGDMTAREIIALLPSLEPADLEALHAHESAHAARSTVLRAIDALLAHQRSNA
jgi:UDP-glucose 4-epimerase